MAKFLPGQVGTIENEVDKRIYSMLTAAFRLNVDEQLLGDTVLACREQLRGSTDIDDSFQTVLTAAMGSSPDFSIESLQYQLEHLWDQYKTAIHSTSADFIGIDLLGNFGRFFAVVNRICFFVSILHLVMHPSI